MATIKVLKLVTNDEIIGIVQDGRDLEQVEEGYTTENLLFITAPLRIVSQYDEILKAHTLYLTDWVPSIEEDTVPIDKKQVLTLGNPNVDLEAHYYELILAKDLKDQAEREKKRAEEREQEQNTTEEKELQKLLKDHDFDDDDLN
jgi:hypothetical protein